MVHRAAAGSGWHVVEVTANGPGFCFGLTLCVLFASYGQAVDSYRRGSHRTSELEIVSNLRNIEKHFLQVTGHSDFLYRVGQFPARNPKSRRAPGIVARHQIGSMPEKFGYVEAVFYLRNDLLRRLCSRLQKIISRTNSRRSRQSARSIAGSREPKLFCR